MKTKKIENFICGNWIAGDGDGELLYNAVNGDIIGATTTKGLDNAAILEYGRKVGGPNLRAMSFHQRGLMLRALAIHLREHLDPFYETSYMTGATKADSWVDIEGGIGNLFANASLRRRLGNQYFCLDGEYIPLSKSGAFMGHHLLVPKEGVAIHINAYNFPVWGMLEKIAVNLIAGVPCVVKPAPVTCYLTEKVVRVIIESGILPKGALQLVSGEPGDILNHTTFEDVVTFTGSAQTGMFLRKNNHLTENFVPLNIEADSLNCMVLGEDVTPDMPEWQIFIKEVRKEITAKAGQKCTAVRRIFVPANKLEAIQKDLSKALAQTTIGNPLNSSVRMGSLAGLEQRQRYREQVSKLLATSQLIHGSLDSVELIDADAQLGAFVSPMLLLNEDPLNTSEPHNIEAFGPVSTLMPYNSLDEVITLSKMGKGSLCSSIITANGSIARKYVLGAATMHGRILVLDAKCAAESTGHGSPLPLLVHGGPGRAGGGEEMGGLRGVKHYLHRVAIQGSPTMLTEVTSTYQPFGEGIECEQHPFTKYFEELRIGDQIVTEKRLITPEDIDQFADLSGDHFYAHLRETDFEGTMFEQQVAHGYFIMSAAAGLFVDSYEKNPVLLNYGIDELRFTKPVYPGTSIYVRFTCKEKLENDKKEDSDIDKGIVKWYVEIFDDTDEHIGVATILTMVKKQIQ